ncbi:MAG: hypothetical protein LBC61_01910 [Candidatus Peribacteria bacterium]|jgi:hypothetical protein|nr:hypothetical protein [Candidatus Peribacteria bacterium]
MKNKRKSSLPFSEVKSTISAVKVAIGNGERECPIPWSLMKRMKLEDLVKALQEYELYLLIDRGCNVLFVYEDLINFVYFPVEE